MRRTFRVETAFAEGGEMMLRFMTLLLLCVSSALAQKHTNPLTPPPKLPLRWDRFYDCQEIAETLQAMKRTWPSWIDLRVLGKSVQGRDLWLVTLNKPGRLPESRPAIYIDANVHGNEIQGGEVCLYTLWYLLENKDRLPRIGELLDRVCFYVLPTVNPDGRQDWFDRANSPHSARTGMAPTDNDRDGRKDEDPPDDLDGDGSITQMRKKVGKGGNYRLDPEDPRLMVRVAPGEEGDYILLGSEGIDNDGDGRINEDGRGGYDMNRNWPRDWQPAWIQFGAGGYPLCWPETRAIGGFILEHPNIAAVQSYHNAGGMILRGPGASSLENYPRSDLRIYDELGKKGETMLPWYRYLVINKDLYSVHGGFVTWTYEGRGIFSFTNELWNGNQYSDKSGEGSFSDRRKARLKWDDHLEQGRQFKAWAPYDHPLFGAIEIGGWTKTSSRVPPLFKLEELCHRNCAFTLYHAAQMPELRFEKPEIQSLGQGVYRVRAEIRNRRLIPTISSWSRAKGIGLPDFFEIQGPSIEVLAGGLRSGPFMRERVEPQKDRPQRLRVEGGVPSHGRVRAEWILRSPTPGSEPKIKISYRSQKGGRLQTGN